jgi:hypothetical protein
MRAFTLKQTTKVGKEDCYHYEGADGAKVAFHAHPTKAWNWIILEGERRTAHLLIEAACHAGFKPEGLATLKVAA